MNKSELVSIVSSELFVDEKDVQEIIEETVLQIKKTLLNKENITITGLGTFKVVDRKPRLAMNPKTGEKIKIPVKKAITFTPNTEIKRKING